MRRWPFIRNVILFFGGLLGVGFEAVARSGERPSLLLLYAAMMGLPAFLRNGNGGS